MYCFYGTKQLMHHNTVCWVVFPGESGVEKNYSVYMVI